MIGSIVRNYKNAGVHVNVSLCVQSNTATKDFQPLFVHGGTGLEIHKLASFAHRELLRQTTSSSIPAYRNQKFLDFAWKVAAFSLVKSLPHLRVQIAEKVPMVIPYTCFIAEHLSNVYREGEERDVCIAPDDEVFINSFAGFHTESKTLGRYEA